LKVTVEGDKVMVRLIPASKRGLPAWILAGVCVTAALGQEPRKSQPSFPAFVWKSEPPADCLGKDMEHSPDGKAYLLAQGAELTDLKPRIANLSWITADQVYLLRVEPRVDHINDAGKYEFFSGLDPAGEPVWTHELK
jgi:hypothetical protein